MVRLGLGTRAASGHTHVITKTANTDFSLLNKYAVPQKYQEVQQLMRTKYGEQIKVLSGTEKQNFVYDVIEPSFHQELANFYKFQYKLIK